MTFPPLKFKLRVVFHLLALANSRNRCCSENQRMFSTLLLFTPSIYLYQLILIFAQLESVDLTLTVLKTAYLAQLNNKILPLPTGM